MEETASIRSPTFIFRDIFEKQAYKERERETS